MSHHDHHHGHHQAADSKLDDLDAFMSALSDNATAAVKAVVEAVTAAPPAAHGHHAHHGHAGHGAPAEDPHAGHHMHHGPAAAHAHGGHDDHAGHNMKMWFHGGCEEVILFDFWRTNTWTGLFFSCLLIFIMGALYEGIKWFRVYLQLNQAAAERCPKENGNTIDLAEQALPLHCQNKRSSTEDVYNPTTTPPSVSRSHVKRSSPFSANSPFALNRLIQAGLYIVQLVLAYWLMLVAMTYNTYLTLAVIFGAGFGHWLFAVLKFRNPLGETADSFATDACH